MKGVRFGDRVWMVVVAWIVRRLECSPLLGNTEAHFLTLVCFGSKIMSDDLHPAMATSKNLGSPKYKKAPDAPKRFKSAFIIFSAEKHKEIKEKLAGEGRVEKVR